MYNTSYDNWGRTQEGKKQDNIEYKCDYFLITDRRQKGGENSEYQATPENNTIIIPINAALAVNSNSIVLCIHACFFSPNFVIKMCTQCLPEDSKNPFKLITAN